MILYLQYEILTWWPSAQNERSAKFKRFNLFCTVIRSLYSQTVIQGNWQAEVWSDSTVFDFTIIKLSVSEINWLQNWSLKIVIFSCKYCNTSNLLICLKPTFYVFIVSVNITVNKFFCVYVFQCKSIKERERERMCVCVSKK